MLACSLPMKNRKKRIFWYLILLSHMAVLFVASSVHTAVHKMTALAVAFKGQEVD